MNMRYQAFSQEAGPNHPGASDPSVNTRSYNFIGARFEPLTAEQSYDRARWMNRKKPFRYLVTPNVDHLVRLARQPGLYGPLYDGAWLSVCDSRILELLARFSGVPLHAVPGSDLTRDLLERHITPNTPITAIVGDQDTADKVQARYGLKKLNVMVPPMGLRNKPDEVAKVAKFIADNPADFVFICVGSPQQEMIAKACEARGDCVGLGLCVGASLDFLAGKQTRSPEWMQKARLEWLYRLVKEPRRMWKRYLVDGPVIFWLWIKWSLGKGRKAEL